MVGTKNNRRTHYTKIMIQEAFLSLLEEKELSKITVTEITEKADINRGTFYNYYQDPFDLFQKVEEELMSDVLPLIKLRSSDDLSIWLARFIDTLNQNKTLSITLLNKNEPSRLLEMIFSEVHDLAINEFRHIFNEQDSRLLEYFFTYFVKGTIGTIVEWMTLNDGTTPEEISQALVKVLPINEKRNYDVS